MDQFQFIHCGTLIVTINRPEDRKSNYNNNKPKQWSQQIIGIQVSVCPTCLEIIIAKEDWK